MTMLRRAAFLDRDGTLIRDHHYPKDPDLVELLPGVPAALQRLVAAGYVLVVITNQSGIARGLLTETDYEAVRARLDDLLLAQGVRLDASYHCPHETSISGPCECRKPGTGMHRQAARALGLDLAHSVSVGDRWRDVAPALELGFRGWLVPSHNTPDADIERARGLEVLQASLDAVVTLVLEPSGG